MSRVKLSTALTCPRTLETHSNLTPTIKSILGASTLGSPAIGGKAKRDQTEDDQANPFGCDQGRFNIALILGTGKMDPLVDFLIAQRRVPPLGPGEVQRFFYRNGHSRDPAPLGLTQAGCQSHLPCLVEKLFLVDNQSADQVIDDGPTVRPFLGIECKVRLPRKRVKLHRRVLQGTIIQRRHDTESVELISLRAIRC